MSNISFFLSDLLFRALLLRLSNSMYHLARRHTTTPSTIAKRPHWPALTNSSTPRPTPPSSAASAT